MGLWTSHTNICPQLFTLCYTRITSSEKGIRNDSIRSRNEALGVVFSTSRYKLVSCVTCSLFLTLSLNISLLQCWVPIHPVVRNASWDTLCSENLCYHHHRNVWLGITFTWDKKMKYHIPENTSKGYRRLSYSIPVILVCILKGVAQLAASFSCCLLLVGFQDSPKTTLWHGGTSVASLKWWLSLGRKVCALIVYFALIICILCRKKWNK